MQGIHIHIMERGIRGVRLIKSLVPDNKGESKRGEASLKTNLPLPLIKGKGIKGIGLLNGD